MGRYILKLKDGVKNLNEAEVKQVCNKYVGTSAQGPTMRMLLRVWARSMSCVFVLHLHIDRSGLLCLQVLGYFEKCTKLDETYYKGWHNWGEYTNLGY